MFLRRRTCVGNHSFDFAAKNPLVELKCGLAFTVEVKVRTQLHNSPLWLIEKSVRALVCSSYNTGVQLIKRQNSKGSSSERKGQESLGAFPFRSDSPFASLILRV